MHMYLDTRETIIYIYIYIHVYILVGVAAQRQVNDANVFEYKEGF
jgi:hypothetical protein